MSKNNRSPDLANLPGMVLDGEEPVFAEPWEAQAFAMAVGLHQRGLFTWAEWADALSAEIHNGEEDSYYRQWLNALETLAAQKGLTSAPELKTREQQWHSAAARTPHGEPIEL